MAAGLGAAALTNYKKSQDGGGTATDLYISDYGYGHESSSSYGAPQASYGSDTYGAPSGPSHGHEIKKRSSNVRGVKKTPIEQAYNKIITGIRNGLRSKRQAISTEEELKVEIDLEIVFQQIAAMDTADCAKVYVCELASKPKEQFTQRDLETSAMFGPTTKRGEDTLPSKSFQQI